MNSNLKTWKARHLKLSKSFILIKPLPLGGPPGQVIIQSDFFFNKDLKYLRYGSKGSRPALSILKMKAAYYPDVGLEQMVPDQIHTSEGDSRTVRTHMRILSVVRIEVFLMYGYDYMKKTVLRRADLNEHDRYGVQIILRINEIHKFSDGTLQQIDEALDYRVKEFKINRMNPGLNTRFWTRKDVDRSKEFMFTIQKRLKTMRIFCNLESFVDGRVRDGDYMYFSYLGPSLETDTQEKTKTTKPSTEWKRSKKTKSFEAEGQKSKPEDNKSQPREVKVNPKKVKVKVKPDKAKAEKTKKIQFKALKLSSPKSYINQRKSQGLILQLIQSSTPWGVSAS
nr:hypothetical protein [Tanacetum cinerariifolium]